MLRFPLAGSNEGQSEVAPDVSVTGVAPGDARQSDEGRVFHQRTAQRKLSRVRCT